MNDRIKVWGPRIALLLFGLTVGYCVAPGGEKSGHDHSEDEAEIWTCSMHPQIQQPESGACPICGMDLIPATSGETKPNSAPDTIVLSERAAAIARIQTTPVKKLGDGSGERKLVGQVARDQNQARVVTAWFGGRIDKLRVSAEGDRVKRGQTIALMYSPEIYAAHNDLLVAVSQLARLKDAEPFARRAVESAAEASKTKLRLLGIRESEITRMAKAQKAWTSVPVRSPFAGTVIRKMVDEGAYVKAGTPLLELSDLSALWIELDAYATDVPSLSVGQPVSFTVDSIPGETFEGNVSFIEPVIDSATRTAKVRVDIQNDGALKPGQYVKAIIESETTDALTLVIPTSAPLYAGQRSVVYVQTAKNEFVSREVALGTMLGDLVIVSSGLSEGDVVVTHGAFTLDADLQKRNGLSLMARPDDREPPKPKLDMTEPLRETLSSMWSAYLSVSKGLAADDLVAVQSGAAALNAALETSDIKAAAEPTRDFWSSVAPAIKKQSKQVSAATDLASARTSFERLSLSFAELLRRFGNVTGAPIRHTFCPMAFDNRGAFWLQSDETVQNVYFGQSMISCGTVEQSVDSGQVLREAP